MRSGPTFGTMHLNSRIRETTLGDVLATIFRARASGVLEIIEPTRRHAVHVRRGLVQAVESEAGGARIGDVAVHSRFAARAQVERARLVALSTGVRLGQAMVATRAISPKQLDTLLTEQRRTRLERLFAVRDAEIRFRVSRPLPAGSVEQLPLDPWETFHGRARRVRRDGAHARTRAERPVRTPASQPRVSHLRTLGLEVSATDNDVRTAYRRLVLELHPDRSPDASPEKRAELSARLAAVVSAYRARANSAPERAMQPGRDEQSP